ncbi:MAG: glycosyltransferase [Symbiopectobacterium sp.]
MTVLFVKSLRREIGCLDINATCELFHLFKKNKFDIIHTNSTKPGIIARLSAKMAVCDYVIHSVHGIAFHKIEIPTKRIFYYLIECFSLRCFS